jgi:hypothetical protein
MTVDRTALRQWLVVRYNEAELRALAYDMGVPADQLVSTSAGTSALALELITWCERRERLGELQARAAGERVQTTGPISPISPISVPQDESMDTWQGQQLDRLAVKMDSLSEQLGRLLAQNAGLEQRVAAIEKRLDSLDEHGRPTQQTYLLAALGVVMTVVLLYALYVLAAR